MAYHHQHQQQQPPVPGSGSTSGGGPGFHHLNFPFGDTTFTKVFVGGLAWETQSETMRRYFEQFGDILEAVVITDKNTGRSKGYGFVTFRDPESARKACADPTPIIDGRRANCNLASLGRPRPALPFGRVRLPAPYPGSLPATRGAYVGNFSHQQAVPYGYQQGVIYSPYGYTTYGGDYIYPQGVYNAYGGQQYVPIYVPGAVNTPVFPYNQLGQAVPGSQSYTPLHGYAMPGHHQVVQFGAPNVSPVTNSSLPTIQAQYPTGVAMPVAPQPQFILPTHSPQFMQGSGSDQNAG